MTPDPKPTKRIVDSAAGKNKLALEPKCRECPKPATDPHHVVLRSQRGDDVEDNIVPLCFRCHRSYHDGKTSIRLKPREISYVFEKVGRNYGIEYMDKRRLYWED